MRRIGLLAFIVSLALSCMGQTAPLNITLLASDGNLYGASDNEFYRLSPTGGSPVVLNSNTSGLTVCLERSDGTLLGFNAGSTYAQFVKVTLSGQITPIISFAPNAVPICPAIASDGNYYGAAPFGGEYNYGFLYQLTSAGVLNIFYNFTGNTDGSGPKTSPIEASDGNLYFFGDPRDDFGDQTLVKYSPTLGLSVNELTYLVNGSPQEGPNGNFFSISTSSGSADAVVQVSPAGASSILYSPTVDSDGYTPTIGSIAILDNQLAMVLGHYYSNSDPFDGCSDFGNYYTLNTLSLSGAVTGTYPMIGTYESQSGQDLGDYYEYNLVQGGNGMFYGGVTDRNVQDNSTQNSQGEFICDPIVTDTGTTSFTSPSTTYPSIQMSFSKTHALPGESTTLTWNVQNAYSLTMRQCYGYAGGGAGTKVPLSGSLTGNAPSVPGAYTFAVVCGGTETGTATLFVGDATLGLSANSAQVTIGNNVTLTATVTNAGTPAPTGSVKFLYGTIVIGTSSLVNGAATLTIPTTGLPAGTYKLAASYAGDANYGPATAPATSVTLVAP